MARSPQRRARYRALCFKVGASYVTKRKHIEALVIASSHDKPATFPSIDGPYAMIFVTAYCSLLTVV